MNFVHDPLSYDFGPLQFTGFGLAVLLGFVISQIIAERELRRRGREEWRAVADLVLAAVVGFLIGAKLYYVTVISRDWSDLFTRAGFVFWGGLIGGIVACWIVIRMKKISFTRISDVAGICIAAGYAVGRTGCWAVGDDYGTPWNSPWAVSFPDGAPPSTGVNLQRMFGLELPEGANPLDVIAVHPTQLYETVMGFIMFVVLWRFRNHKHAEGWLFGLYCVLAGAERFVVEFYRAKDDRFFGVLTAAQVIAIGFVVIGATWMMARNRVGPGRPGIHARAAA